VYVLQPFQIVRPMCLTMNPILPSITATSLRDRKKGYPKHKCCGNKNNNNNNNNKNKRDLCNIYVCIYICAHMILVIFRLCLSFPLHLWPLTRNTYLSSKSPCPRRQHNSEEDCPANSPLRALGLETPQRTMNKVLRFLDVPCFPSFFVDLHHLSMLFLHISLNETMWS